MSTQKGTTSKKRVETKEQKESRLKKAAETRAKRKYVDFEVDDIKMLTVDSVSEKLGVGPSTLRSYIRKGLIRGIRICKRYYISDVALKAYLSGE